MVVGDFLVDVGVCVWFGGIFVGVFVFYWCFVVIGVVGGFIVWLGCCCGGDVCCVCGVVGVVLVIFGEG